MRDNIVNNYYYVTGPVGKSDTVHSAQYGRPVKSVEIVLGRMSRESSGGREEFPVGVRTSRAFISGRREGLIFKDFRLAVQYEGLEHC